MASASRKPAVAESKTSPSAVAESFIALIVKGDFAAAKAIASSVHSNPTIRMIMAAEVPAARPPSSPTGPRPSRLSQTNLKLDRDSATSSKASGLGDPPLPPDDFLVQYFNARVQLSKLRIGAPTVAVLQHSSMPWLGASTFNQFQDTDASVLGFEGLDTDELRVVADELWTCATEPWNSARGEVQQETAAAQTGSPGALVVRGVLTFWSSMLRAISECVDELSRRRSPLHLLAALLAGRRAMDEHTRVLDEQVELVATGQPRASASLQGGSRGRASDNVYTSYAVQTSKLQHPVSAQLRSVYWDLWARAVVLMHDVAWLTGAPTGSPLATAGRPANAADSGGGAAALPQGTVPQSVGRAVDPLLPSPRVNKSRASVGAESSDSDAHCVAPAVIPSKQAQPVSRWQQFKSWVSSIKTPKPLPPLESRAERELMNDGDTNSRASSVASARSASARSGSTLSADSGAAASAPAELCSSVVGGTATFDAHVRQELTDHGRYDLLAVVARVQEQAAKRKNVLGTRLCVLYEAHNDKGLEGYRHFNAATHSIAVCKEFASPIDSAQRMDSWVLAVSLPRIDEHDPRRRDVVVQSVCALYSPGLSGYTSHRNGAASIWLVRPTVPYKHQGLVVLALEVAVAVDASATMAQLEEQEALVAQSCGAELTELAKLWSMSSALQCLRQALRFDA